MTVAAMALYSFLSPQSLKVHLMQLRTDSRALSLPKMPGPWENKRLLCVLSGIKNQLAIEFLPVCFQEYLMVSTVHCTVALSIRKFSLEPRRV